MEILSSLNLNFRRAMTLIILGVLASTVAVLVVQRQPERYSAKATVFISQVFPGDSNSLGGVIADFQAIITLPTVADATVQATGANIDNVGKLDSDVSKNGSTLVDVTVTAETPDEARRIVETAPREAMKLQLKSSTEPAVQAEKEAKEQYEEAQRSLDAWLQSLLTKDPDIRGVDLLSELQMYANFEFQLESTKIAAMSEPNAEALRANYDALIAELQNRENLIKVNRNNYQLLRDRVELARTQQNNATADLLQAQARQAIIDTETVVAVDPVVPVSKWPATVRGVVATLIAVLAIGLGVFALLDSKNRVDEDDEEDEDDYAGQRQPFGPASSPSRDLVLPRAMKTIVDDRPGEWAPKLGAGGQRPTSPGDDPSRTIGHNPPRGATTQQYSDEDYAEYEEYDEAEEILAEEYEAGDPTTPRYASNGSPTANARNGDDSASGRWEPKRYGGGGRRP